MTPRCPACGTSYDAGARFCSRDGTRLVHAHAGQGTAGAEPGSGVGVQSPGARGQRMPDHRATELSGAALAPAQLGGAAVTLGGRYRIESKAGQGGMAFVYLATDLETGDRLAIKVLTPVLARDPSSLARLRREADIGSRLAHPNICHIIRLGESDGLVYIVMPFVEGELLSDRTFRVGQIPLEETIRLVADIAAGLHAAHARKVVHRDLKPENVMLSANGDGSERAVIMDFGLAKERAVGGEVQKLTATGIVLGTPEFMSPEQIRGKPLDARTDVYALGVMTYEMLTGKLPFEGSDQQEIMLARLRGQPIPLRKRRPDIPFPADVERVLAKCLAADLAHRYPSAAAFVDALADAASGRGALSRAIDQVDQGVRVLENRRSRGQST